MSSTRELDFATEDDAIAEVERLRRGCSPVAGKWTLEQACWHLNAAVLYRMKQGPFPPNTSEQDSRAGALQQVLTSGKLPPGINAPDDMIPPAESDARAVDALITSLKQLRDYKGKIAPHRIFGHLSDADARRLNLIHCAHHLSKLAPTT